MSRIVTVIPQNICHYLPQSCSQISHLTNRFNIKYVEEISTIIFPEEILYERGIHLS
jgi:hypothetical protein